MLKWFLPRFSAKADKADQDAKIIFGFQKKKSAARRSALIVFIHGFLGSSWASWGRFPELLNSMSEVRADYDVATFGYDTGLLNISKCPSIEDIAAQLRTALNSAQFASYKEIVIIAHSMGGLVARRYIADSILNREALRVTRVVYFATPHQGALAANLAAPLVSAVGTLSRMFGGLIGDVLGAIGAVGKNEQLQALAYDSDFFFRLEQAEYQCGARDLILAKYIVAQSDGIVGKSSAIGSTNYDIVPGVTHSSIVEPDGPDHLSVRIVAQFLMATNGRRPWHSEADLRQPVLQLKRRNRHDDQYLIRNRFVFSTQMVPFVGRAAEIDAISAFLAEPDHRFRWMLISGPGGIGKSRLALEVAQTQSAGWWNAGFLDVRNSSLNWATWQPQLPTLIVIDYAGRDAKWAGPALRAMAEREQPHLLLQPVRVLILEREASGPWLDELIGSSHDANDPVTCLSPSFRRNCV